VAISGTEAEVRAGGQRCASGPMRVRGAGAVKNSGGGGCGSAVRRAAAWSSCTTGKSHSRAARSPTSRRRCALGVMRGRMRVLDAACGEDHAARCAARAAWGCGTRWSVRAVRCLPRVACRTWVRDRLSAARSLSAHTLLHRMFWCSVADGTLLWRIGLWPGLGPDAVVESQQGPKPGCEARDSPPTAGSWISLGLSSVLLEASKGF
jgi:hypothetical protein